MKKLIGLLAVAFSLSACSRVPAGHVGVQFNNYGDDKGVSTVVLDPGTYAPGWNTKIELMPTFTQSDKWTQSSGEGKAKDEAIRFQVGGGIEVITDIQIAYHVEKSNAVKVFNKYRKPIEEISDNFLRSYVRDEFNVEGTKYDVESLQGAGKAQLLADVQKRVIARADEIGITVESISYLGALHFPANVVASINAKIQATQDAMKVENEVRKTKAEQEKVMVVADAQVQVAKAEAQAIELRGAAYRNNPQVLQREIAEMSANALRDTHVQIIGAMPTLFKDVK